MKNLMEAKDGLAIPIRAMTKESLITYVKEAGDVVSNQVVCQQFKGVYPKSALIYGEDGNIKEVLAGIDKLPEDPRTTVQLFARLAETLPPGPYCVDMGTFVGFDADQMALGWGLGSYRFEKYLKNKKPREWARLFVEGVTTRRVERLLASVFMARDLINTPAGDLGTEELCAFAGKLATRFEAELHLVMGGNLQRDYPAIHAVGKGSTRPPALIDLRWGNEKNPKVTIIGKGVVFDTGGLDIKPPSGMLLMKKDMGGAAIILGLAQLIMANKLPVRLRMLVPTVENAVSGDSYRPGDVVATRKGITVEIGNTDAEGRMILCDAIADAVDESPDLLIDMATLTGACRVALGQDLPGYYTPSDELAAALETASREVADPVWRMPLWMPYVKSLKSSIADINNVANTSMGGSVTAALFLHEFVKPYKNWLHMDVYGWRTDSIPGTPKGGEATALRAVYHLLENRYPKK